MKIEKFIEIMKSDFYTGVPDSQLKAFCNYLMNRYGIDAQHHIIAANEGNAAAIAAGYHLATGRIPIVYMQNSGEGNMINPAVSLLHESVYAIPVIFVIGWRGEPGTQDEPQHIRQGEITLKLLEDMDIESFVIRDSTTDAEVQTAMKGFNELLNRGKSVAYIISKNALSYAEKPDYSNKNMLNREEVIEHIVRVSGNDPVISTTGKASRELFEIREKLGGDHKYDFLTVGSMGHSSSLALGIAMSKPNCKVWCIDGDGAVLMHMGSVAVIGSISPGNMVHIVMNNEAHETVGGMPTAARNIRLTDIAKACGYHNAVSVDSLEDLDKELEKAKSAGELTMIEARCSVCSRNDLGRPTTGTMENKKSFMEFLFSE